MIETVKMFDYWAFHDSGFVQFFQICEGEIFDYREYDRVEDSPIAILKIPLMTGPDLRYHGRSYLAPVANNQSRERE